MKFHVHVQLPVFITNLHPQERYQDGLPQRRPEGTRVETPSTSCTPACGTHLDPLTKGASSPDTHSFLQSHLRSIHPGEGKLAPTVPSVVPSTSRCYRQEAKNLVVGVSSVGDKAMVEQRNKCPDRSSKSPYFSGCASGSGERAYFMKIQILNFGGYQFFRRKRARATYRGGTREYVQSRHNRDLGTPDTLVQTSTLDTPFTGQLPGHAS